MQRSNKRYFSILLLVLFSMFSASSYGQEHEGHQHADGHETVAVANDATPDEEAIAPHASEEKEGINVGEIIIEHVADSHEIHFLTLGEGTAHEHHVSIPLPVILYTHDRGLEVFSSAKFHNHEHAYDRYKLKEGSIYIVNAAGGLDTNDKGEVVNDKVLDFSITKTVVGIFITVSLLFLIFFTVARGYTKRVGKSPKGLQSLLEPLIVFIRDEIAKPAIGKKYERFLPYLLTIFFFIWIANMLGLIPFIGGFNITGNIAVTMVLALFTFALITFNGNKNYWAHIIAPPGVPIALLPLMIVIEIMGLFTKPIVLMIRLFANITGGHIIILSFVSLIFIFSSIFGVGAGWGSSIISIAFAIFMNVLELLVAFLQAFIFTLLSALYFGAAVEEHHH
jgi:F-type H+-transporting ATPase subunit a